MDENQNKPDEELSGEPQVYYVDKPELRKISKEELEQILKEHKEYLSSQGDRGKRAVLSYTDLSGLDFCEADFHGSYLIGANLSKANLSRSDFYGADLSEANLSSANLSSARFFCAILSRANLSEATLSNANLISAELSRANLSEATLSKANLSSANLSEASLSKANLSKADLSEANLSKANLSEANLSKADLSEANLSKANLSQTNLSGTLIDYLTIRNTKKIINGQVGVNGIWASNDYGFDSAAILTLRPPGNSMQGPNPDAILESLKRSRRLHGYSLALVGIVLLTAVLNLTKIEFIWTKGVIITPDRFGLIAMPISIVLTILINLFLSDAFKGVRYIQDRQSAVFVGKFPWALSRYAGHESLNKIMSFIIRFIMSFYLLAYIYFLQKWGTFNLISKISFFNDIIFAVLSLFALFVSLWTFLISQKFQRPILFDQRTEIERKGSIEQLNMTMRELLDTIKPKEAKDTRSEKQKTITTSRKEKRTPGTKVV
ncbi:pentapeptide repeat-containing protein [Thermodesulfobacteriota bacterium]